MDLTLGARLRKGWNAFRNKNPTKEYQYYGAPFSYRPDRPKLSRGNDRSIVNAIYNRIAIDVAAISIQHVQLDEDGRYSETINDSLNQCLNLRANVDQSGRDFVQDIVMSMLDEGCVAILPVDTDRNPDNGSFDIYTMRTAKVVEWYPQHVKLKAYNELTGNKEEITVRKDTVAIVENPLYSIVNEPNSVMQRLIRKLNLLDAIDEHNSSGKLDLIIQLPYVVKGETKKRQAEERRREVEEQLVGSKYGIAYTDGTEKIVQLNRSVENNYMNQIEYLTNLAFSQLGITAEILNGTATEEAMLNYQSRILEPILSAITDAMKWSFLTPNARTRGQSIMFFKDPFKIIPIDKIAEIADKMTRNEIMTSNEIRQKIGMKPSKDPSADELRNKNLNQAAGEITGDGTVDAGAGGEGDAELMAMFEQMLDSLTGQIDSIVGEAEEEF